MNDFAIIAVYIAITIVGMYLCIRSPEKKREVKHKKTSYSGGVIFMKKPRSYAVFKDEHEEDLLYLEKGESGVYIFATKSGIYRYWPEKDCLSETCFKHYCSNFDRIGPKSFYPTDEIKYVAVDERVLYEYQIESDGVYIRGKILVPPDYNDEKIRKLIMEDLNVKYRKE